MIFKFRNLENGQAHPIPPGDYSIGRDEQNHVQLQDLSVSRFHAILFNQGEELFIEDNGSANGVSKDNEFISGRVQLKLGDIVYIGSVPFRVDPELLTDAGEPVDRPSQFTVMDRAIFLKKTERLPAGPRGAAVVPSVRPEKPLELRRSTAAVPISPVSEVSALPSVAAPKPPLVPLTPQQLYPQVEIPEVRPFPWGSIGLALLTGVIVGLIIGILMAKQVLQVGH